MWLILPERNLERQAIKMGMVRALHLVVSGRATKFVIPSPYLKF